MSAVDRIRGGDLAYEPAPIPDHGSALGAAVATGGGSLVTSPRGTRSTGGPAPRPGRFIQHHELHAALPRPAAVRAAKPAAD